MIRCKCAEGIIDDGSSLSTKKRVPMPGWETKHDCEYVRRRNSCIREAEMLTIEESRRLAALNTPFNENRFFHMTMNRLVSEQGRGYDVMNGHSSKSNGSNGSNNFATHYNGPTIKKEIH